LRCSLARRRSRSPSRSAVSGSGRRWGRSAGCSALVSLRSRQCGGRRGSWWT
jgi:hypothetical protein